STSATVGATSWSRKARATSSSSTGEPRPRPSPSLRAMTSSRTVLAMTILAFVVAADPPQAAEPPGTRYVYLIRHAIYDRDDKADDRTGNGINALGREQAKLMGARLAALPVHIAHLYTSDFMRARDTAGVFASALRTTPEVDPLLHESTPTS